MLVCMFDSSFYLFVCVLTHFAHKPMMIGGVQKQADKQSDKQAGKRKRGPSKEDVSAATVKTKQLRMDSWVNGSSVDGNNQHTPTTPKVRNTPNQIAALSELIKLSDINENV